MPRRGGASGLREVKRKRRKKLWLDANKRRSRNVKISGLSPHKKNRSD